MRGLLAVNPEHKFWLQHSNNSAALFGNSIKAHQYYSVWLFRCMQAYVFGLIKETHVLQILDVGCGNGLFSKPLCQRHDVIGLDMSQPMLAIAHNNGLRPINALAEAIPVVDNCFDVVLCVEMLQCMDNAKNIIHEMLRTLKPRGLLIIHTINRFSIIRKCHALIDQQTRRYNKLKIETLLSHCSDYCSQSYRIIYNYFPLPMQTTHTKPLWLAGQTATSFALIMQKR